MPTLVREVETAFTLLQLSQGGGMTNSSQSHYNQQGPQHNHEANYLAVTADKLSEIASKARESAIKQVEAAAMADEAARLLRRAVHRPPPKP